MVTEFFNHGWTQMDTDKIKIGLIHWYRGGPIGAGPSGDAEDLAVVSRSVFNF